MKRRRFIAGLCGAVAGPLAARTQPNVLTPRIGLLMAAPSDGIAAALTAFRLGLKENGLIRRKTLSCRCAVQCLWHHSRRVFRSAARLVSGQPCADCRSFLDTRSLWTFPTRLQVLPHLAVICLIFIVAQQGTPLPYCEVLFPQN